MRNREDVVKLFEYFQNGQEDLHINEKEAMISAYENNTDKASLSIKILSVFGGILASLTFLGFLLIAGLYDSEIGLMAFGGIFIAVSIWINKKYERIIMDTVSVSSFIIGFLLIGIGLEQFNVKENILSLIFIILALTSLIIVQNYIISFISVIIIHGSILTLIVSNEAYNLIHFYVSILALATFFVFVKEAKTITLNKTLSKLYDPIRIGLIFSFLIGLLLLGKTEILPLSTDFIWIPSIVIISAIVYLISIIFNLLEITETKPKISFYIFTLLTLLPTAMSPAISGALLIILLSFMVNYKTGLVIGIISFIYFISQYYYDLNFTLLTKSILLFTSGILFIGLYFFTHKNMKSNE